MRRALVLVAVAVVVAAVAPIGVVAQDGGNETTSTTTEVEETTIVAEVDERLRVTDHWYNSTTETYHVTLENTGDRRRSAVTITEAIQAESDREAGAKGSRTFGIETLRVDPDETVTVAVSVRAPPEHADDRTVGVMITTEESVKSGQGTYLDTSLSDGGGSIFDGSASWGDVRSGVFFTVIATIVSTLLGGWHLLATRNEDVEEVDTEPDSNIWGFRND